KVGGLRARGGFEIVDMTWKAGKLKDVVIRSTIGGNLRIRSSIALKMKDGALLSKASGENTNKFYYVEETPDPVVSPEANLELLELKETLLYDIETKKGETFTLV